MSNAQKSSRFKASFDLDGDTLRQIVAYDCETGNLVWRRTHGKRVSGQPVGTAHTARGNLRVHIAGKPYALHRLVWLYVHGLWPVGVIDHIDGNPRNNRIENLRDATQSQNVWNSRRRCNNTSGFKGVSWNRRTRAWRAYVTRNGKTHWLGHYATAETAFAARVAAADRLHGEFARHE